MFSHFSMQNLWTKPRLPLHSQGLTRSSPTSLLLEFPDIWQIRQVGAVISTEWLLRQSIDNTFLSEKNTFYQNLITRSRGISHSYQTHVTRGCGVFTDLFIIVLRYVLEPFSCENGRLHSVCERIWGIRCEKGKLKLIKKLIGL